MDDLISRQAAIDRAVSIPMFGRDVKMVAVSEIKNLPSAQPDKAKVLAEILDGCPLTHPCDKLWSPDGWCKDHCKDDYKEPSAECWMKYAEAMASDSTDTR